MGKIREFFYLLAIAVLISLSMIFIGAAFREEYPLWKNQKILEDLRSDVKAEETGDGNPGIDWEKLKKINLEVAELALNHHTETENIKMKKFQILDDK